MVSPEYLAWCVNQGVVLHGVRAGPVPDGGRGVLATQELLPGQVFLEVPEACLMSCASARADPVLGPLLTSSPDAARLDSQQVLALHLLHEVSKVSQAATSGSKVSKAAATGAKVPKAAGGCSRRWSLYVKELPRSYTTLGYFGLEAVKQLQVASAQDAAGAAVEKLQDEWRQARPLLAALGVQPKYCSFAAWRWAATTLLSRTMYVPWDSAGALTPFGDLLNHQYPPAPHTTYDDLVTPSSHTHALLVTPPSHTHAVLVAPAPTTDGNPSQSGTAKADAGTGQSQSQTHADATQGQVDGGSYQGTPHMQGGQTDAQEDTQPQPDTHSEADMAPIQACPGSAQTEAGAAQTILADSGDCSSSGGDGNGEDGWWGDGSFDEASRTYQLRARRRYPPGSQVYVSYGQHPNLELLSLYGFVLHDNPHDEVQLPLGLVEAACQVVHVTSAVSGRAGGGGRHKAPATSPAVLLERLRQAAQQAVGAEGLEAGPGRGSSMAVSGGGVGEVGSAAAPLLLPASLSQKECFLHADGSPSWQLLKTLRAAAATPAERAAGAAALAAGQRLSAAGDCRVLQWLQAACTALLQALPTTLDQDTALLNSLAVDQPPADGTSNNSNSSNSSEDGECVRLAIQWRMGYKRVLHHALNLCEKGLAHLSTP